MRNEVLPKNGCYVLNLDEIEDPGTHWVAVFHNEAGHDSRVCLLFHLFPLLLSFPCVSSVPHVAMEDLKELKEKKIAKIREETAKEIAKLEADCELKVRNVQLEYEEKTRKRKRVLDLKESVAKRRKLVAEEEKKIQEEEKEAQELQVALDSDRAPPA